MAPGLAKPRYELECEVIFMSSKSEGGEYWDEVALRWDAADPTYLWREHCDDLHDALLRKWLRPGPGRHLKTDLFDESLATGLLPRLSTQVEDLFGIDLSLRTARRASRQPQLRNLCACDVRNLPFDSDVFHSVLSNSTLDHFGSKAEIMRSLEEIWRVLAPGGELILTLDNLTNPIIRLRHKLPFRLLERLSIVPYYVGETFRVDEAKSVLASLGFEIVDVTTFMHFPRFFSILISARLEKSRRRDGWLRMLNAFERLGRWPTRFWTGHYFAIRARKLTGDQ